MERFKFTADGQTSIRGRPTYCIRFQAKNPAPPAHRLADRLLDRLAGTLWIDCQEFEIVRAHIHLQSEVNLLGGVLGSLKKLSYTLDRTRVADDAWFTSSATGDFEGRKLLDLLHIKTSSRSVNIRQTAAAAQAVDSND